MDERATNYSPTVRIVNLRVNPRNADDVIVQELVDGEWKKSVSFNSLSNDYAYTNARDFAKSLVRAAASTATEVKAPNAE